ncbi:MAG TPA: helix-turn-helix domain-containing protein [Roseiflexaceae bacterium]|nr:helix-turn-helix domain-containing protein [Roseiflexaceae bacterium]
MSHTATFGSWLRRLRQMQGMTQEALAEQVGCATQTIRKLEAGMRRPSHQMAWRLADMLHISGDERNAWMQTARALHEPSEVPPPSHAGRPLLTARNLPSYFTTFVGRTYEQAELLQLLHTPGCRLITLVGPGGIGKTRLAIEMARRTEGFRDGRVFVPLASVGTPHSVVPAISDALGLELGGPNDLPNRLIRYLSEKQLLLILDNLEHLMDQGDALHELLMQLLAQAPAITILVTSREQLQLAGEWVIELEGLARPDSDTAPEQCPAVDLFLEHARHIHPDITPTQTDVAVVREICRLLGDMPLAIELAAAWVTTLSYHEIAAEIRRGLDFLSLAGRDIPPRHRSMRVVFDQTWQRLDDAERMLLARIAIFRGGFTRDAATFVARMKLPQLAGLVQQALVYRSGTARYNTHEVIRRFAEEKLGEIPDHTVTRRRFVDYYLALSSEAAYSFAHYGDRRGLDQLIPEIDNLRLAMHTASRSGLGEQGARISTALRIFWALHSLYREGVNWAEQLLVLPGLSAAARGDLLTSISYLARAAGMLERARTSAEEALQVHRQSGDPEGLGWALGNLAQLFVALGEYPAALALHRE